MPSDKKPLHDQLAEWLSRQGYPLEMEVAQDFRAAGFTVAQSTYYSDPETGEAREIDVTAFNVERVADFDVRLTCFVECKLSANKPWVMFTSRRDFGDAHFDFFSQIASQLGTYCLSLLYEQKYFSLPLALRSRDRLGYGVTQGLREKQEKLDVAYPALMQAAKAAVARAAAIHSRFEVEPTPETVVEVAVPVVVIDAPLFEYYLESDLTKTLRTFHWGELSFGNPIGDRGEPTLVHIVTKQGLPEFVEAMKQLSHALQATALENAEALRSRWQLILLASGKGRVAPSTDPRQ
jgi:hypothetical protein